MTLGGRLKNLRLERRLTMQEVAIRIGLAKSSYAGYEGGHRNPPVDKLIALSQLFQVSSDFILGLTDNPDPVSSLHKKHLWDGILLTEKELVLVQQVVELVVNRTQETSKKKMYR